MRSMDLDLKPPKRPFADCNSAFQDARYVIFGVPFDATTSHHAGTAKGPDHIREESYNFETYLMDIGVELEEVPMTDIGDLAVDNTIMGQKKMLVDLERLMDFLLSEGKVPLMMGGEHSIAEASVSSFMKATQQQRGLVVVIDAHLDFRDSYLDNPHSHASVTRRVLERWGSESVCVIGARSGCKDEVEDAVKLGLRYATSRQVLDQGIHEILESWVSSLSLRDRPIYLSVDIDGVDPSFAPGTGTPEPWGLSSWDVLQVLEELYGNIQAMDVVEVSPVTDQVITPSLGGKLMRQLIGLKERKAATPPQ